MGLIPKGNTELTFTSPLGVGFLDGFTTVAHTAGFPPEAPIYASTPESVSTTFSQTINPPGRVGLDFGKLLPLDSNGNLDQLTQESGFLFDLRTEHSKYMTGIDAIHPPYYVAVIDTTPNPDNGRLGILYAFVGVDRETVDNVVTAIRPIRIDQTVRYGICEVSLAPDSGTIINVHRVAPLFNTSNTTIAAEKGNISEFNDPADPLARRQIPFEVLIYHLGGWWVGQKGENVSQFRQIDSRGWPSRSRLFNIAHPNKTMAAYDEQGDWGLLIYTDGSGIAARTSPAKEYNYPVGTFEVDGGRNIIFERGFQFKTIVSGVEGTSVSRTRSMGWISPTAVASLFVTGLSEEPLLYRKVSGTNQTIVSTLDLSDLSRINIGEYPEYFSNSIPQGYYVPGGFSPMPFKLDSDITFSDISDTGTTSFTVVVKRISIDYTPGTIQKDATGAVISESENSRLMTVTAPTTQIPDEFFLGDGDIRTARQRYITDYKGTRYEVDSIILLDDDEDGTTTIILRF